MAQTQNGHDRSPYLGSENLGDLVAIDGDQPVVGLQSPEQHAVVATIRDLGTNAVSLRATR